MSEPSSDSKNKGSKSSGGFGGFEKAVRRLSGGKKY